MGRKHSEIVWYPTTSRFTEREMEILSEKARLAGISRNDLLRALVRGLDPELRLESKVVFSTKAS